MSWFASFWLCFVFCLSSSLLPTTIATLKLDDIEFPTVGFGKEHTCARAWDSELNCAGFDVEGQRGLQGGAFTSVCAGYKFTCGIDTERNSVSCAGEDTFNQVFDSPEEDVEGISIACGYNHACIVKSDYSVQCWGKNDAGQTDSGSALLPSDVVLQVSCGEAHCCGLIENGAIKCWGDNGSNRSSPPSFTDFRQVELGTAHSCGLRSDGSITCWGDDGNGESTAPAGTDFTQVAAGNGFSCGVKSDNSIECWGGDTHGQQTVPGGTFVSVNAGVDGICATTTTRTLTCWGENTQDQLEFAPYSTFSYIGSGDLFTCGNAGGDVSCWGSDSRGEQNVPVVGFNAISVGWRHICGIDTTLDIQCWGAESGVGLDAIHDAPDGNTYKTISCGYDICCATLAAATEDEIVCWGSNTNDERDNAPGGTFLMTAMGTQFGCALSKPGGSIQCWGNPTTDVGQTTPVGGSGYSSIVVGDMHGCALKAGAISCWGEAPEGSPLSNPAPTNFVQISSAGDQMCALDSAGAITCIGDVAPDQPTGITFSLAMTGRGFACGVTTLNAVVCWGDADGGEAGTIIRGFAHSFWHTLEVSSANGADIQGCGYSWLKPCASVGAAVETSETYTTANTKIRVWDNVNADSPFNLPHKSYLTGHFGGVKGTPITITCVGERCASLLSETVIRDITFTGGDNSGSGGAVSILGSSGLRITIEDCTFVSNIAYAGGALSISPSVEATIRNCVFTSNEAHGVGGAIYSDTATVEIDNCTFTSNSAGTDGGGVYVSAVASAGASVAIVSSTFTRNNAIKGGGLYILGQAHSTLTSTTFNDNVAYFSGGAVGLAAFGQSIWSDVTCRGNYALTSGGCLLVVGDVQSLLRIEDSTFLSNAVFDSGGAAAIGGLELIAIFSNSTFSNNTAEIEGGAVAAANTKNLTIVQSTFTSNSADGGKGGAASIVQAGSASFLVSDALLATHFLQTTFTSNSADYGGAIYAEKDVGVEVHGCTLTNNSAYENGGALFGSTVASFNITSSLCTFNSAYNGACVYLSKCPSVLIQSGSIENNAASEDGGGVYVYQTSARIDVSTFTGNSATRGGGGVFWNWGTSDMQEYNEISEPVFLRAYPTGSSDNSAQYGNFVASPVMDIRLDNSTASDEGVYHRVQDWIDPVLSVKLIDHYENLATSDDFEDTIVTVNVVDDEQSLLKGENQANPEAGIAYFDNLQVNAESEYNFSISFSASVRDPDGTRRTLYYGGEDLILRVAACEVGEEPDGIRCATCPWGQFGVGDGAPCELCDPGSITSSAGQGNCSLCESGSIAKDFGMNTCEECKEGQYAESTGMTACVSCDPGTYQLQRGSTYCEECGVGTYARTHQSSSCDLCEAGKFSNSNGSVECTRCDPGYYQSGLGSEECDLCDAGYFASGLGSASCSRCPEGYVSLSNRTQCRQCPVGTHANALTDTCDACPTGEYTSTKGSTSCLSCEVGQFANNTGLKECFRCPPGTYQSRTGASTCNTCSDGTIAGASATELCSACSDGYIPDPENNRTQCVACDGGTYALSKATTCTECEAGTFSLEGQSECQKCAAGTYTAAGGKNECQACPSGSEATADRTGCVCSAGYYSIEGVNATINCQTCPAGADCTAAGVTELNIETRTGYWRVSNTSLSFYKCLNEDACPQGSQEGCTTGYTGTLCAICDSGYHKKGTECTSCGGSQGGTNEIFMIVMTVTGLMVVIFVYWLIKPDKALGQALNGLAEIADSADLQTLSSLGGGAWAQASSKGKTLIGFTQILTHFAVAFSITWPSAFEEFLHKLKAVNLDFIELSSVDCVMETNFFKRFIISCLTPISICCLMAICYGFVALGYRLFKADKWTRTRQFVIQTKIVKAFLFMLFIMYPAVSAVIFQLYKCKEVEGTYYLEADFTIQCFESEWNSYAYIGVFFILLYPIGIPLATFLILYSNRDRLTETATFYKYGFLYGGYKENRWWFEIVELMRKLVLTSIIIFVSQGTASQIFIGILVTIMFMMVAQEIRPFQERNDYVLQVYSQFVLLLCLVMAMMLMYDNAASGSDKENYDSDAMGVGLIFCAASVFALTFILLSLLVIQTTKSVKEEQEMAKQLEEELEEKHAKGTTSTLSSTSKRSKKVHPAPSDATGWTGAVNDEEDTLGGTGGGGGSGPYSSRYSHDDTIGHTGPTLSKRSSSTASKQLPRVSPRRTLPPVSPRKQATSLGQGGHASQPNSPGYDNTSTSGKPEVPSLSPLPPLNQMSPLVNDVISPRSPLSARSSSSSQNENAPLLSHRQQQPPSIRQESADTSLTTVPLPPIPQ